MILSRPLIVVACCHLLAYGKPNAGKVHGSMRLPIPRAVVVTPIDTANTVVLNTIVTDSSGQRVIVTLTEEEAELVVQLMQDSIAARRARVRQAVEQGVLSFEKAVLLPPLATYRKQLVPRLNWKGEKEVQVYCHRCFYSPAWRKSIVGAKGGGSCYMEATINLMARTCNKLHVNAPK